MGLSPPVAAAVDRAVEAVLDLIEATPVVSPSLEG
jgi:hypothetical protein